MFKKVFQFYFGKILTFMMKSEENYLKARSTVMPIVIFSPESGGRQKTSNVRADIIIHGNMTL